MNDRQFFREYNNRKCRSLRRQTGGRLELCSCQRMAHAILPSDFNAACGGRLEDRMEIERKFTVKKLPENLERYPSRLIEQGYLNTNPVIRVRRDENDYYLTYKGKGLLAREEYNLPLNEEAYRHLIQKADGRIITKRRYLLPCDPYTIELDVFLGDLAPLVIAEVEFPDLEAAHNFLPPDWFLDDVTMDPAYHNSNLVHSDR